VTQPGYLTGAVDVKKQMLFEPVRRVLFVLVNKPSCQVGEERSTSFLVRFGQCQNERRQAQRARQLFLYKLKERFL